MDRSEPGARRPASPPDTTLLREVTTDSLVGIGTGGLTLVATVVMMGLVDVVLLGVTLGVILCAGTVLGVIVPRINRASKQAQDAVGVMRLAGADPGALRTVKASGAEHREEQTIHAGGRGVLAAERTGRQVVGRSGQHGRSRDADRLDHGPRGGRRTGRDRRHPVGTLVAFLLTLSIRCRRSSRSWARSPSTRPAPPRSPASRRRCAPPAEPDAWPVPLPTPGAAPAALAFDDVRFRYADDLPYVHHGVTFSVPARGMTAFVGPSAPGIPPCSR